MVRVGWTFVVLVTCTCGRANREVTRRADGSTTTITPEAPDAASAAASCGLRAELVSRDGANTLTLVNEGERSTRLVLPGDGSDLGLRTPTLTWRVTSNGRPVQQHEVGPIGGLSRIEATEIFSLAPGERRSISAWVGAPSVDPGTYEVALHYENDPQRGGEAPASAAVRDLVAATDACRVTTNAVTVTF
jgi:hypothetical protein